MNTQPTTVNEEALVLLNEKISKLTHDKIELETKISNAMVFGKPLYSSSPNQLMGQFLHNMHYADLAKDESAIALAKLLPVDRFVYEKNMKTIQEYVLDNHKRNELVEELSHLWAAQRRLKNLIDEEQAIAEAEKSEVIVKDHVAQVEEYRSQYNAG